VARPPTLERQVLEVLWDSDRPLVIREILEALVVRGHPVLAYTTVQTVANRLVAKGLLDRDDGPSPHRYRPTRSREEHTAQLIKDLLDVSPDRASVLLRLAEQVDADDADRLREALGRRSRSAGGSAGGHGSA